MTGGRNGQRQRAGRSATTHERAAARGRAAAGLKTKKDHRIAVAALHYTHHTLCRHALAFPGTASAPVHTTRAEVQVDPSEERDGRARSRSPRAPCRTDCYPPEPNRAQTPCAYLCVRRPDMPTAQRRLRLSSLTPSSSPGRAPCASPPAHRPPATPGGRPGLSSWPRAHRRPPPHSRGP